MRPTVLIIDDEEQLRSLLKRIIQLEGLHVLEASTLRAGRGLMEKQDVDVILCDVKLPDGSGVDFANQVKQKTSFSEIILLTAYATVNDGVQAMKNGAFDYLIKGNDNDKVIPVVHKAIEKVQMARRIHDLEQRVGKQYSFVNVLGSSSLINDAVTLAKKVAPANTTVLLLGETGTGKEVFAQAIHYASPRANKSFIALNCSAVSKELLESEIFGHKAGAFTGANKDKRGLVEEANGGTLFLDEIGEMHVDAQAKLLRVLETGEFIRVGDTKSTRVDVRIIAATNRDLKQEIEKGRFREDLFYRLNVFTISLPPLRDRKDDILLLARNFLDIFAAKTNKKILGMQKSFIGNLQQQTWKGNIRELKNVIERAVILTDGPELGLEHLPLEMQTSGDLNASQFDLAEVEKAHIQKVLRYTKGNKTKASELLNIGLTTLYRKIDEYKITVHE